MCAYSSEERSCDKRPSSCCTQAYGAVDKDLGALAQSPGFELIGAANGLETIDAAKRLAIERCKAKNAPEMW